MVAYSSKHRPRELRRRVVLPARLRSGASWSDACILNISSRGLMIHARHGAAKGGAVELRRGDYVIVARVVWQDGDRAGLRAEERVPVEAILALAHTHEAPPKTVDGTLVERRKAPRRDREPRVKARIIEYAGVGAIAAVLAGGAWSMVEHAFASPLLRVSAALDTQS